MLFVDVICSDCMLRQPMYISLNVQKTIYPNYQLWICSPFDSLQCVWRFVLLEQYIRLYVLFTFRSAYGIRRKCLVCRGVLNSLAGRGAQISTIRRVMHSRIVPVMCSYMPWYRTAHSHPSSLHTIRYNKCSS